jgi:hypothetical protein
MTSPVILLHESDNVVVCCRAITAGERISVNGSADFVVRSTVDIGHKVARVPLPRLTKVIKYGTSIGSMTESAEAGDWVHLHNMKSDYMSAHTRSVTGEET